MQNAAFRAAGLDWTYELMEVASADLAVAVAGLRGVDVAGANVTIPHKQAVMDQLDSVDAEAVKARAVNTITRDGSRLVGSNTDIAAIRAVVREAGVEVDGAAVVILGAGGSARAAAVALAGARCTFLSRRPGEVNVPGHVVGWADPQAASLTRSADILVNATPLGRREEMPLRPGVLPKSGLVIDLVYVTGGTPLVRKARSLGLRVVDGWEILLAQGARSFETWTGRHAPIAEMRETLDP